MKKLRLSAYASVVFLSSTGSYIIASLLPLMLRSYGFSVSAIGLTYSISYGVICSFAGFLGGLLSDVFGRKALFTTSLISTALLSLAISLDHSPYLIAAPVLYYFFRGLAFVVSIVIGYEIIKYRGFALGLTRAIAFLAIVAGSFLLSYIYPLGYSYSLLTSALLLVVASALAFKLKESLFRARRSSFKEVFNDLRCCLRQSSTLSIVIATAMSGFNEAILVTYYLLYLRDVLSVPMGTVFMLRGFALIMRMGAMVASGIAADKTGRYLLFTLVGWGVTGSSYVLYSLMGLGMIPLNVIALAIMLQEVGSGISMPSTYTLLFSSVPANLRGMVMGSMLLFSALFRTASPLIASRLWPSPYIFTLLALAIAIRMGVITGSLRLNRQGWFGLL